MARPASPRAWAVWSFATLERFASPQSVRFGGSPSGDRRLSNSREVALTIKMCLERSVNGRGKLGPKLLADFYVREIPWDALSDRERRTIRKTERLFKAELIRTGFLPPPSPR